MARSFAGAQDDKRDVMQGQAKQIQMAIVNYELLITNYEWGMRLEH